MMADRPIIFSAPMVKALLADRKTMTRRLAWRDVEDKRRSSPWQKVKPGDRLWVRENIRLVSGGPTTTTAIVYDADGEVPNMHFFEVDQHKLKRAGVTPCIHMPRWASRLTLIVTATKVEPLHFIRNEDAKAEGALVAGYSDAWHDEDPRRYVEAFAILWDLLHGDGAWEANPEVVALTFRVVKANIDSEQARAA